MSGSARSVALAVILRVTEHGGYSNLALAGALRRARLAPRDRDLVTELTYGTLRRLLVLDRVIAAAAERPTERITPHARAIVRLGAYQLLETRIPAHAAVSETVELASAKEKGFVNAVLRRVASSPGPPVSGADENAVSARTGLSVWAVAELGRLLDEPDVEPAAQALAERAPLTLRANPCRIPAEELERALTGAGLRPERGVVGPDTFVVPASTPDRLPGSGEGWFAVQDQASAFVVAALDPRPGERVLDLCAGPGGKAADIACRVGAGGLLVAADVSPARAGLVRATLDRLGVPGRVLVQDARKPALPAVFDRVLIDAPCSGIGAARRRPELLWRPERRSLSSLARLQAEIARQGAALLRPGGTLLYSVCTFPRAETDAVCDALARGAGLEPITILGPDGPAERVRLWPHRHGTDAMFLAAFRRGGPDPGREPAGQPPDPPGARR